MKGLVAALAKNRHYQVYYGETVEQDDPAPAKWLRMLSNQMKKTKVAGSDTAGNTEDGKTQETNSGEHKGGANPKVTKTEVARAATRIGLIMRGRIRLR